MQSMYQTPATALATWLDEFCTALDTHLETNKNDWILDLQSIDNDEDSMSSFRNALIHNLDAQFLTIAKQTEERRNKIYWCASQKLYDSVIGKTCTAQCPLCKEMCDFQNSLHPTCHKATFHRPQCICNVTWQVSNKLVLETCNSLVASDYFLTGKGKSVAYRDYQSILKDWNIEEAIGAEAPKYWMWFVCHFYDELIAWSGSMPTEIPDIWKRITKQQAIESLDQAYNFDRV